LLFEDRSVAKNFQLVDGPALGRLLAQTDVSVLVLNACRSAQAEVLKVPTKAGDATHNQARVYGSLAQQVMDAGVAGVVAMRYNIYVATAAQFIGELYATLLQGEELGAAVTLARKHLAAQPVRDIGEPITLRDWAVPIVYEAAPLPLVDKPAGPGSLIIFLPSPGSMPLRSALDAGLPSPPDVGFLGRDETLFAVDRAFDIQPVVLLHGEPGSGKSAISSEFARWYARTGGVHGSVLYTSFSRHIALAKVLDQLGEAFDFALKAKGIQWQALNEVERRSVAMQVLQQVQVLWIWDDISLVADRPDALSTWAPSEQEELLDFLQKVRDTQARFLLSSRHDEHSWLGELPARIAVSNMPIRERLLLAGAIATRHGQWRGDIAHLRPLLDFIGGNPQAIIRIVGQVVRDGLSTKDEIQDFISHLEADGVVRVG
jgi:hypothetical protein